MKTLNASFEVGKRYKTIVTNFYEGCGLVDVGDEFTCHLVDSHGYCWTEDVLYKTYSGDWKAGRWCVAASEDLLCGAVVEVE